MKFLLEILAHVPQEILVDVVELVAHRTVLGHNVVREYVAFEFVCYLHKHLSRGLCLAISSDVFQAVVGVVLLIFC